jgi:tetratricopeptide (TPR) repeat protein
VLAFLFDVAMPFFGIRAALAEYDAGLNTRAGFETAVRLEPSDSDNWYLLGRYWQYNLIEQDTGRAILAYRTSLRLNSLSADTWLDLASAYETEGELDAARKAFLEAKRVYPVSSEALWRYGNFLLRQNELKFAFGEFRSAIEEDPKLAAEAVRTCRHVEPDFSLILDRVLPPIAQAYLNVVLELTDESDTDDALKVWSKLLALHPKLHSREVIQFVDGLLHGQRMSDAARVWRQAINLTDAPKTDDPAGSLIWDGGFETDVTGGALAWRFTQHQSAAISYDQNVKHSGLRALRLDIAQKDISGFVGVCQWVVVEPDTAYEFSAWLRTKDIAKEESIFFRLGTLGLRANPVFETTKLDGTTEWTRISTPWTSPNESRLAQVCLARSRGFDQRHGIVWVDDVSLLKLDAITNRSKLRWARPRPHRGWRSFAGEKKELLNCNERANRQSTYSWKSFIDCG